MKHLTPIKSDFKAFYKSPWGMALMASIAPQIAKVRAWGIDPDGFNLAKGAQGFMYLQWTVENGQIQTRYDDGAGSRGDGSEQALTLQNLTADALGVAFQPEAVNTSCFLKAARTGIHCHP